MNGHGALKQLFRSKAARPAGLALVVGFGLLALLLRFGVDAPMDLARRLFRPPEPPAPVAVRPSPAPRPDPLGFIGEPDRGLLVSPFLEWPTQFSGERPVDQRSVCRWLRSRQYGRTLLNEAGSDGRNWICNTGLATFGQGDPATVSSLFVSLRGAEPDRLDFIRVKLNLIDPATAAGVRQEASAFLREIHARFGRPLPKAVDLAITDGLELKLVYRQTTYSVLGEFGDPRRINVVVELRPDTGILDARRFDAAVSIMPIALLPSRPGRAADIATPTVAPPVE